MFVSVLTVLLSLAAAPETVTLWTDLGPEDQPQGLRVTSEPDGRNAGAVIGERPCRHTLPRQGSPFMYVDVDDVFRPPEAVFVTIAFYDQHGMLSLHFDAGPGMSAYRTAPEAYAQQGTRRWRTETFTLRRAEFQNRQNGGTDFRLHADGPLAVARITLSTTPPEGFQSAPDPAALFENRPDVEVHPAMDVIQQWQVHEPVPEPELADSAYETARRIGVTSLQSYVGWAQLEPRQGELDYSVYDPVVDQLRKHGLKWLPFIIMGPMIATPEWWREEYGVAATCLEHGESTPIQSIWNPNLRPAIRRFLEAFHAHYEADVIEALNFGISGNWGESIMVAGGGFGMRGEHSHLGWWCGDPHAREDWRSWVRKRYETLEAVNATWDATYQDWAEIEPFIPPEAASRRAAADLFQWYCQSMTDYAEYWISTAHELYPDLPIYLCTGGHGQPQLGADFAAQARMCARYGAGLRITNQSDDAAANFAVTRMVSSSTRLYGGYYTTEPGGANSPSGMAGRVFDAVAGGAAGVYFKTLVAPPDQPSPTAVVFAENAEYLVPNTPDLTVAALMPNSALALDPAVINQMVVHTQVLRTAFEFEFIDENMIADGMLPRFKALLVTAGDTVEQPVLDAIGAWVEQGGVLVAAGDAAPLRNVRGETAAWWPAMEAGASAGYAVASRGAGFVVEVGGAWPEWRDQVIGLVHEEDMAPWDGPLAEPIDGVCDNVLATRVGNRVFYLNNSDDPATFQAADGAAYDIEPRAIVTVRAPK